MTVDEARVKSRELWDRMAPGWDKLNDYLWSVSRQVGEWLVDHVDPQPGQTILELAAGPGNTGFVAAGLVGDSGRVISTDFAEDMVAVARARAEALGLTNVEFRVMDAENMDLADDSVDGIVCRWGFMLMLDPAAALRESRRVLRPGGKLAYSVWGLPAVNPWATIMGKVLTDRGTAPKSDPFGPGGLFSLAEYDRNRDAVRAAGFEHVELEDVPVTWTFTDFERFWEFSTELAGAVAMLIEGMSEEEVASLKKDVEVAVEPFRSGDGYAFPGSTVNVLAY